MALLFIKILEQLVVDAFIESKGDETSFTNGFSFLWITPLEVIAPINAFTLGDTTATTRAKEVEKWNNPDETLGSTTDTTHYY